MISIYFIVFLSIFMIRNIIEPRIKPKIGKVEKGKATLSVLVLSYLLSAITVLVLLQKEPSVNPLYFISGVILLICAYSLRIVAIRQLWDSYNQGVLPSGQLVTTGIYSQIRHPLYFFYNLEMLALIIIKFNIISVFALTATLIATLVRMKQEEANLLEKFGVEFTVYRSKTKKFIPYVY